MHGREVPDEAPRMWVADHEVVRVLSLDLDPRTGQLTQQAHAYVKTQWWRMGKPPFYYFLLIGMEVEVAIEKAREILGS